MPTTVIVPLRKIVSISSSFGSCSSKRPPSLSRSRLLHSVRPSSREIPVHRRQLVKRASGKANRWLRRDLAELCGETPLTLAQTETGDRGLVP
ncbi:hypothetical protein B5V01_22375 [Mesorhizobium erdmanii]|uniref:Uncharacterized protein n=2 Tax=Mesorhizobium TaxID=68287 RepID=A0A3M9X523_9HYPH|nr:MULTISPECIES: antitoxin Xre/MbcA/ParS toxin-binding domain-containing protein [Mesorhizobium]RNJ42796.1 hypothetical protein DNR46_27005 [Mesorhizobium japonicum]RXT42662.1 hypothetical protein B5V01_22375 [Mesorhizobium erdmanii]